MASSTPPLLFVNEDDLQADQDWLVWFDLACEDILAIETAGMTPALRREVEAMGATIHRVAAPTRKEAVERVFPEDCPERQCLQKLAQDRARKRAARMN